MSTLVWIIFVVAVAAGIAGAATRARHPERRPAKPKPSGYVETRRPTVTRVAAGGILGGPLGALIGLAWRKKRHDALYLKREEEE